MNQNLEIKKVLFSIQAGWFIVVAFFSIITLPQLFMDGMFMDAVQYTAISKNLANGFGTFWFPMLSIYNVAGMPAFLEQPPLFFGILSIFFNIFGDSLYTERIYLLLNLLLSFWLIVLIWKELFPEKSKISWLPILFYITNPLFFWTSVNLVIENTMLIFTLAAVLFILRFYKTDSGKFIYLSLSAIFIFLATMTKGVPGLFPLSVPIIYTLFFQKKNLSKSILHTIVLLLIIAALYFLIFAIFPRSRESYSYYFFDRLIGRVQQEPVVKSHFYILGRLFLDLFPMIAFSSILLFFKRSSSITKIEKSTINKSLFLFIAGLTASLPLILTLVQRRFYYLPSIPLFSIAFAAIISDQIKFVPSMVLKKYISISSVIIIISGLILTIFLSGKPNRDQILIEDVNSIGVIVKDEKVVSVHRDLWTNWSLQCYIMRYWGISLEPLNQTTYFIADKSCMNSVPEVYVPVKTNTKQLLLYKKSQPE